MLERAWDDAGRAHEADGMGRQRHGVIGRNRRPWMICGVAGDRPIHPVVIGGVLPAGDDLPPRDVIHRYDGDPLRKAVESAAHRFRQDLAGLWGHRLHRYDARGARGRIGKGDGE